MLFTLTHGEIVELVYCGLFFPIVDGPTPNGVQGSKHDDISRFTYRKFRK
jgi:hypothetical protein